MWKFVLDNWSQNNIFMYKKTKIWSQFFNKGAYTGLHIYMKYIMNVIIQSHECRI